VGWGFWWGILKKLDLFFCVITQNTSRTILLLLAFLNVRDDHPFRRSQMNAGTNAVKEI